MQRRTRMTTMVSSTHGYYYIHKDRSSFTTMHKAQLHDPVILEHATTWAKKLFEFVPGIQTVLVQFDNWEDNKSGRKNKPGMVKANVKMMTALRQGDLETARLAAESNSGIAWCSDLESLTKVLTERICRGNNSWVDDGIYHGVLMVTVFED